MRCVRRRFLFVFGGLCGRSRMRPDEFHSTYIESRYIKFEVIGLICIHNLDHLLHLKKSAF